MDERAFEGCVALVTGGSGGIGSAICRRLAEAGAAVVVGYGRGERAARAVVRDIEAAGGRAVALGADMRDAAAPAELVDRSEDALGPVDVLVANAGISRPAPFHEVDAAAWDEMLAINLRGPFLLARRVVPGMRSRRFGRVLFMSSVAGFTGGIVGPHYAASKAGLHGLTHHLASRTAPDGVTVNALAPALIEDTNMLPGPASELSRRIPAGRLGRPEEVADLALAILRNGYMTNQVVSLDGGMYPR
jgi:3-oxoacyl-[acyl-carrier protein] reductase